MGRWGAERGEKKVEVGENPSKQDRFYSSPGIIPRISALLYRPYIVCLAELSARHSHTSILPGEKKYTYIFTPLLCSFFFFFRTLRYFGFPIFSSFFLSYRWNLSEINIKSLPVYYIGCIAHVTHCSKSFSIIRFLRIITWRDTRKFYRVFRSWLYVIAYECGYSQRHRHLIMLSRMRDFIMKLSPLYISSSDLPRSYLKTRELNISHWVRRREWIKGSQQDDARLKSERTNTCFLLKIIHISR